MTKVHTETSSSNSDSIYKDLKRPIEERVDDLVSRMTLEEKISQMIFDAPAIERLDIPAYNWNIKHTHMIDHENIGCFMIKTIQAFNGHSAAKSKDNKA